MSTQIQPTPIATGEKAKEIEEMLKIEPSEETKKGKQILEEMFSDKENNMVWDITKRELIDRPDEMTDFLNEIKEVCKKHNLSISHEDYHGSFIIQNYDESNLEWLFEASKEYD